MNAKINGMLSIDTTTAVALILTADGPGPSTAVTVALPQPVTATATHHSALSCSMVLEHLREDIDPDRASFPLVC